MAKKNVKVIMKAGGGGGNCEIGSCACTCGENRQCILGFCECNHGWDGEYCSEKAKCIQLSNCTNDKYGISLKAP
jgi:hypothetical protein